MKRQFFAIPLFLIAFCFIFSTKIFATNCTTDQECKDNGSSLYGCAYEVSGVSTTWYCQAVHPELTFCSSDQSCDDDNSLVGCFKPQGYWKCRVTYTPAIGNDDLSSDFSPYCKKGVPESGINTAIGCIKIGSGNELITTLLQIATGIGGGLALALILYGVFIVTTSAGMPDKLKAGSEIITSAIIGLIFILLSVFLVNLIGINILGIPGLS